MNASDLAKTQSAMVQPNQSELAEKEKGFLSSLGDLAKTNAGAGILSGLATGLIGGIATGDFGGAFDAGLQGGAYGMQRLDQLEKERANRLLAEQKIAQNNALKGNFGTVFEDARRKGLLTDDAAKDIQLSWLRNQAKDPYSLYNQGFASSQGKMQGQLGLAGQLEAEKTMGREQAQMGLERGAKSREAEQRMSRYSDLINQVDANKDVLGKYAGAKQVSGEWLGGALGGFDEDQLRRRGSITRAITSVGNDLVAKAKASGQSGMNTLPELERTIKGLSENASPEYIKGQIDYLMQLDKEMTDNYAREVGASTQYGGGQQSSGSKYKVISVR